MSKAKLGRPKEEREPTVKATVVLYSRQLAFLDRLCVDVRAKTGKYLDRAGLIRGLIDALAESKVDLSEATSEGDVKAELLRKLRR